MVLASLRTVVKSKMRCVAQNVDASRVRGRREQQSQSSLPGIARRKTRVNALMTLQVGFTRLAAHYTAQLGRARVAVQSILFAKNSYEEDGPPEIGSTRFRGALVRKSGKPDLRGQARG